MEASEHEEIGLAESQHAIDRLEAEIADLRSRLEAAEEESERIMAANDVPEMYGAGQRRAAERILAILSGTCQPEEKSELHDWKRPRGVWHCVRCGAEEDGWARPAASGCSANAEAGPA